MRGEMNHERAYLQIQSREHALGARGQGVTNSLFYGKEKCKTSRRKQGKILLCFPFDYFKFSVDYIFWCNQTWENSKNLLQKTFYVETNGA